MGGGDAVNTKADVADSTDVLEVAIHHLALMVETSTFSAQSLDQSSKGIIDAISEEFARQRAYRVLNVVDMDHNCDIRTYLRDARALEELEKYLPGFEELLVEAATDGLTLPEGFSTFVERFRTYKEELTTSVASLKEKEELRPVLEITGVIRDMAIRILAEENAFSSSAKSKADKSKPGFVESLARLSPESLERFVKYFTGKAEDLKKSDDPEKEAKYQQLRPLFEEISRLELGVNFDSRDGLFATLRGLGRRLSPPRTLELEHYVENNLGATSATFYTGLRSYCRKQRAEIEALKGRIEEHLGEPEPSFHPVLRYKNKERTAWETKRDLLVKEVSDLIFGNFGTYPFAQNDAGLKAALPFIKDIITAYEKGQQAAGILSSIDDPKDSYLKHVAEREKFAVITTMLERQLKKKTDPKENP